MHYRHICKITMSNVLTFRMSLILIIKFALDKDIISHRNVYFFYTSAIEPKTGGSNYPYW